MALAGIPRSIATQLLTDLVGEAFKAGSDSTDFAESIASIFTPAQIAVWSAELQGHLLHAVGPETIEAYGRWMMKYGQETVDQAWAALGSELGAKIKVAIAAKLAQD